MATNKEGESEGLEVHGLLTEEGNGPQDPPLGATGDIWRWAKRQAIGSMDLSLGARECWRLLEAFPPGSCYPSHYYIAETMRKDKSSVRRYLRELKKRDYIEVVARYDDKNKRSIVRRTRQRGQTSNSYVVLDQPDLIARAIEIVQDWQVKSQRSKVK